MKFSKSLHMGDLCSGSSSVESPHQFYFKWKERLSEACFNLHKFESNSVDLKDFVNG